MDLAAGKRSNILYKIENAFGLPVLFVQSRFDAFCGLLFGKITLSREGFAIVIGSGNDPISRAFDTGNEWRRRRIDKAAQHWRGFMCEMLGGELGVSNGDFPDVLDTPKFAVHAHGTEGRSPQYQASCCQLRYSSRKLPKQIGRSIRQARVPPRSGWCR
jgi:hypothetical protein